MIERSSGQIIILLFTSPSCLQPINYRKAHDRAVIGHQICHLSNKLSSSVLFMFAWNCAVSTLCTGLWVKPSRDVKSCPEIGHRSTRLRSENCRKTCKWRFGLLISRLASALHNTLEHWSQNPGLEGRNPTGFNLDPTWENRKPGWIGGGLGSAQLETTER